MIRKIFKTGHSFAVTLPGKVLRDLGLKLGDVVDLRVDEGKNKLEIQKSQKKSQQELALKIRHKLGGNGSRAR